MRAWHVRDGRARLLAAEPGAQDRPRAVDPGQGLRGADVHDDRRRERDRKDESPKAERKPDKNERWKNDDADDEDDADIVRAMDEDDEH